MALGVESIVRLYASAKPSSGADYDVLTPADAVRGSHLAVASTGAPALLIPVAKVASEAIRLTHGLALRGVSKVEFARGSERWTEPAAVVECRDPKLARTFAGLVAALIARVEATTKPSWPMVSALFTEWERLLGRREVLSGESELGLWAELWCLTRTQRPSKLLEAWRGPDAERVDFLLDGFGFEVKAGRRPNVHMVSQDQVERPLGDTTAVLVSMLVMPDPLKGRSLAELVANMTAAVEDVAEFEEKLAATGYSRDDDGAYHRRYAVLEPPRFYDVDDVPRVRAADRGVSRIRFRAELDPEKALTGPRLQSAIAALGITPAGYEYPCA